VDFLFFSLTWPINLRMLSSSSLYTNNLKSVSYPSVVNDTHPNDSSVKFSYTIVKYPSGHLSSVRWLKLWLILNWSTLRKEISSMNLESLIQKVSSLSFFIRRYISLSISEIVYHSQSFEKEQKK
jgi:hypothetical protein